MVLPPLTKLIVALINVALKPLQLAFQMVASILGGAFSATFEGIKNQIQVVKNIFSNIIDFVRNVFTGNWRAAWENIKNIFYNIASGLGNIFKSPINFIIGIINGFIRGLNRIKIPDWVPRCWW